MTQYFKVQQKDSEDGKPRVRVSWNHRSWARFLTTEQLRHMIRELMIELAILIKRENDGGKSVSSTTRETNGEYANGTSDYAGNFRDETGVQP